MPSLIPTTPESVSAYLQYGALGLLAMVLAFGLFLLAKLSGRFVGSLDRLNDTLQAIGNSFRDSEKEALKRHADTREFITALMKDTRHSIADRVHEMTLQITSEMENNKNEIILSCSDRRKQ